MYIAGAERLTDTVIFPRKPGHTLAGRPIDFGTYLQVHWEQIEWELEIPAFYSPDKDVTADAINFINECVAVRSPFLAFGPGLCRRLCGLSSWDNGEWEGKGIKNLGCWDSYRTYDGIYTPEELSYQHETQGYLASNKVTKGILKVPNGWYVYKPSWNGKRNESNRLYHAGMVLGYGVYLTTRMLSNDEQLEIFRTDNCRA